MKQFKGIEKKKLIISWVGFPTLKIGLSLAQYLGLLTPVFECWPSVWWQQWQKDVWSQKRVLGLVYVRIPSLQSSMLLHRQTCSWCMPPSAAVFVSSPPAPCFSWHFVLDLLCCPCTSHTNTQLWSHKPSLEHRKINGSLLQRFVAAVSMHLADKRPFSPASLDAHLSSSCWWGVRGLPALFSHFLLSLVQTPQFSGLIWIFFMATGWHLCIPFTNQEIFLSSILQTYWDQSYFFFLISFPFTSVGKG